MTDPDSHLVHGMRGWLQGYNAQAAVNESQIVLAAEVSTASPDFGQLDPMVGAVEAELEAAGVTEVPDVVLADAGYWHQKQMEDIVSRSTQVLIPPDSNKRKGTSPGWDGGLYAFMRRVLEGERGALYHNAKACRAGVRTHQVQPAHRSLQRRGRSAAARSGG